MNNNFNKRNILLIEDNIGDIKLIEEAIKANNLNIELTVLDDGEKAKSFYQDQVQAKYNNLPDLIICDLNLPRFKGDEIIKLYKSDSKFRPIPLIVLTTSNLDLDINSCYRYGANAYLIKPLDVLDFFDMIKHVHKFWFEMAEIPVRRAATVSV